MSILDSILSFFSSEESNNMGTINKLMVGESLQGDGNEVAHIDLLIGPRGSAAETAFANCVTNKKLVFPAFWPSSLLI